MMPKQFKGHPEFFTTKPLSKFEAGDTICFVKGLSPGFRLSGHGKFIKLEKGLVTVRYAPNEWEPTWVDERSFSKNNPGGVVRVRPSSCFLWGKAPGEPGHPHCNWFEGTTFGVTGLTE